MFARLCWSLEALDIYAISMIKCVKFAYRQAGAYQ